MTKHFNADDVKVKCKHCDHQENNNGTTNYEGKRPWSCPYCNNMGSYMLPWYYGLDQQVVQMRQRVVHRDNTVWEKGEKVKVVMCSRFGDVGLTKNLEAVRGYDIRVDPLMLLPLEE